jgi:hypothetical protein
MMKKSRKTCILLDARSMLSKLFSFPPIIFESMPPESESPLKNRQMTVLSKKIITVQLEPARMTFFSCGQYHSTTRYTLGDYEPCACALTSRPEGPDRK